MKLSKKQKIIMSMIIFTLLILNTTREEEKKTAFGDTLNIALGGAGIWAGIVMFTAFPWLAVPLIAIGALTAFPGIIGSWVEVFRPKPTIPGYVWIIGFFILALMAMRRRGK